MEKLITKNKGCKNHRKSRVDNSQKRSQGSNPKKAKFIVGDSVVKGILDHKLTSRNDEVKGHTCLSASFSTKTRYL